MSETTPYPAQDNQSYLRFIANRACTSSPSQNQPLTRTRTHTEASIASRIYPLIPNPSNVNVKLIIRHRKGSLPNASKKITFFLRKKSNPDTQDTQSHPAISPTLANILFYRHCPTFSPSPLHLPPVPDQTPTASPSHTAPRTQAVPHRAPSGTHGAYTAALASSAQK